MRTYPLKSSNISDVGYDDATQSLEVGFKNGSRYHYTKVPKALFEAMLKAPSPGRYFHQVVKVGGYPFVRIN